MKFKIYTNDNRNHVYESSCSNLIDFLIALEDFDQITLSGTKYQIESIRRVIEL